MAHPYRVRDIASQSGLSEATVDRVLNSRGRVSAAAVAEVTAAIAELDRQRTQLRLAGRTLLIDVVVQAPDRFATAVRQALESELPTLRPGVVRSRFHLLDGQDPRPVVELLARIGRRRPSHGLILKAPDAPEVAAEVARLSAAGVPVVTLVTDISGVDRLAYVGVDNSAAGATAAYLIARGLGDQPGDVVITRGRSSFLGEDQRHAAFVATLAEVAPERGVVEVVESMAGLAEAVADALQSRPGVAAAYALYSFASSNRETVAAFDRAGRACRVFVAHDLVEDNRALLLDGRLSFVLEHDLRADLRRAAQLIMYAQLGRPPRSLFTPLPVSVITPYNLPRRTV